MRQALVFLVTAGLAAHPLSLAAQDIPDALKDKALVVRVTAIVPAAVPPQGSANSSMGPAPDKAQAWRAESSKYTVPGTPVPFKLVGTNVAIIVQVTPFERSDGKGATLIAQGQVWVKPLTGGLSYHTTIESLSVDYGETVLFFPLGLSPDGTAPIRLEISVVRATDAQQKGEAAPEARAGSRPDIGGR